MKSIKRLVAITLSFVVIMSGIYWSEAPAKDVQAATTTEQNTDMLNVKVQVATNDTNVMRFVSSVDSLNYKSVGFEITPEGEGKTTHPIYTVFKRIASTTQGVEYTYSPKVVDTSSEYFMTAKWNATPNVNYTVRAFAVLPNGNTIYGTSRCVALEDGRSTTHLNMSFQTNDSSALEGVETIDNVTYAAANNTDETKIKTTTAEVIDVDGNTVHVRVQSVNGKELASVTNFTFGEYGSGEFRNLLSEYDGSTGDTSWYKDTEKELIIASSADLYGMASLANNNSKTFANQTIYVVSDIAVNSTTEGVTAKAWADATIDPANVHKWTRIKTLAGTFDGQMHTISGIYMNANRITGTGLFGTIAGTGKVCNLYIKESLFKSDYADLGSVAGFSEGTISTVFSNAYVIPKYQRTGGIVGNMHKTSSVDNCWFDGEMRLPAGFAEAGGIVGKIAYNNIKNTNASISHCLYTGTITFGKTSSASGIQIGGIVGGAHDYCTPTVNLENCVSAGEIRHITGSTATNGVSSVYGGLNENKAIKLNLMNVYGTNECFATARIFDQYVEGQTIKGTGSLKNEADLKGANGYQNTLLDFEDTWVARKDDVPALKAFTNEIDENEKADLTGVEQDGWYTTTETVFGIPSASALKKFSEVSESDNFQNKYVYLTNDIEVNEVKTGTLADWEDGKNTPSTSWKPIGFTQQFKGTFDGRMHTISGIYMKVTDNTNTDIYAGYGLFGRTGWHSTVQNFSLVDSYFEIYDEHKNDNEGRGYIANLGSIAGYHHGYLNNVYSNAKLVSNRARVGGIMGHSNSRGVSNVWYDGSIELSSAHGRESGGIIGCIDSSAEFTNLLFTGTISYNTTQTNTGIGGIIGITYANNTGTPALKNVLSVGTLKQGEHATNDTVVGSIVGLIYKATVKVENIYVSTDFWNATHNIATDGTGTLSGTPITATADELSGTNTVATTLDYTNTWVKREGGVPVLKLFADMVQ